MLKEKKMKWRRYYVITLTLIKTKKTEMVSNLVDNLKYFAKDVLRGQFDVFSILNEIAKKRRLEWQNS